MKAKDVVEVEAAMAEEVEAVMEVVKAKDGREKQTEYLPRDKWNALSAEEQQAIRDSRDSVGVGTKHKVAVVDSDTGRATKKVSEECKTQDSMTHQDVSVMTSTVDHDDEEDPPELALRDWLDSDFSDDEDYPLVTQHVKRIAKRVQ